MKNKMNMKSNTVQGGKTPVEVAPGKNNFIGKLPVLLFFVAVWALFAFYEQALLFRVSDLSVFLFNGLFFDEMVSVPAGFLSYIASFMVQFFHYPVLGATLYVLMLYIVYRLTKRLFAIPQRLSLVALLPVAALVATNTELGYWIFYLKMPGYWFVAVTGVIVALLAMLLFKALKPLPRMVFVAVWLFAGYPLFGFYALASAMLMGFYAAAVAVRTKKGVPMAVATLLLAAVLVYIVPQLYYNVYGTVATEHIYTVGIPAYQWVPEYIENVKHEDSSVWYSIYFYWVPFVVLLAIYVLLSVLPAASAEGKARGLARRIFVNAAVMLPALLFMWFFWYNDNNFRIENKQNRAMWNEDWEAVAEYAKDAVVPTRQVVMNKNLALYKLGRAAQEMFSYPDGSSEINSPMGVHLTQTGGKMMYWQYGRHNFCYRWCMEDAVEYGWRVEYLKHAVRSMLLSGEYRLAERYINILKSTLFYSGWAERMETFVKNPALIEKEPEFAMPLKLARFPDALAVDESFVEVYLTKDLMNLPADADPLAIEIALTTAMIRKDVKSFWYIFDFYLKKCQPSALPRHYQEALLLFMNLDKGQTVQIGSGFIDRFISKSTKHRFDAFIKRTTSHKGKKEEEMAPFFKGDFGDTYFYFYFFVRKIKTN